MCIRDRLKSVSSTDDVDILPSEEEHFPEFDRAKIKMSDFVLVSFSSEHKKKVYYVGKITKDKDEEGDYEISYLRKSRKIAGHFYYPEEEDIKAVDESSIEMHLINPISYGQTKRQKSYVSFAIHFDNMDIR